MVLPRRVVVVAVDLAHGGHRLTGTADRIHELLQHRRHHELTIRKRIVLRPVEVGHVFTELSSPLSEVRQIGIGDVDEVLLHHSLRRLDVTHGELVAYATGP